MMSGIRSNLLKNLIVETREKQPLKPEIYDRIRCKFLLNRFPMNKPLDTLFFMLDLLFAYAIAVSISDFSHASHICKAIFPVLPKFDVFISNTNTKSPPHFHSAHKFFFWILLSLFKAMIAKITIQNKNNETRIQNHIFA